MAPTPTQRPSMLSIRLKALTMATNQASVSSRSSAADPAPRYRAAGHEREAPYGNLTSELGGRLDPQDIVDHAEEAGAGAGNQQRCELIP